MKTRMPGCWCIFCARTSERRADGQTQATTIQECQNWPRVIKTQMAFHNYQNGLLFVCIDANVFTIDSWPAALGHDNCNYNFRLLSRLPECSCIRVLSKLIIYNVVFTTAWFKPGWLISNEIRYDNYQFRWNIFCDKTKLEGMRNWTREMKWNYSVNLFHVAVWKRWRAMWSF